MSKPSAITIPIEPSKVLEPPTPTPPTVIQTKIKSARLLTKSSFDNNSSKFDSSYFSKEGQSRDIQPYIPHNVKHRSTNNKRYGSTKNKGGYSTRVESFEYKRPPLLSSIQPPLSQPITQSKEQSKSQITLQ